MRISSKRLVYTLIGAALAVGVLTSALARPEPRLAASADCYGLCRSVTELSLSRSTVSYGHEQVVRFRVRVRSGSSGTGVPTGYVVVESGTKILCSIRLHHGRGSCSPAARALLPGLHVIVAHYGGNRNFRPSTSNPENLLVLRHRFFRRHWSSMTTLSLSRSRVSYGQEQVERFTVRVRSGSSGTGLPTGYVAVESGTKILCSIRLYGGTGSCSPAAGALPPGLHVIVAHDGGTRNFGPSTSSRKILLVLRH